MMKEMLEEMLDAGMIRATDDPMDISLLRDSYLYAERKSQNDTTWTGALICDAGGATLSAGANRYPDGIMVTDDMRLPLLKMMYLQHAERDAVYNAARLGIGLKGSSLYMAWLPCCDCAQAIVSAGVKKMVFHHDMAVKTQDDWADNIFEALRMLRLADIDIYAYKGKIGGCVHRFKKEIWEP